MKILIINWTWYPSGGDWTYIENLIKFYESKGHEVIPFSMHNEKNYESDYSNYFISEVNYKELNKNKSLFNGFRAIQKTIYSFDAKKKIKRLLKDHKIDIAHINNIHHYLTPNSIIPALKKKNIPIIWTLHDYVILCPNTTFTSNGAICEKCKDGKYYNCIINKCKKGSRMASAVAALESYTNDFLNPYKYVDYFICPSKFIASKFIEYGYPSNKIIQVYNLFDQDCLKSSIDEEDVQDNQEKYLLYVGRLSKIKGVSTLLNAVKDLNIKLYIIGDGEDFPAFDETKTQNALTNVVFLGKKNKNEVIKYLKGATLVIIPSEWYENLPYSLVEAQLLSKPVLGAKIGGIPELIIEGETGFLFESGSEVDLKNKLSKILDMNQSKLHEIGVNAGKKTREIVSFTNFELQMTPIFNSLNMKL